MNNGPISVTSPGTSLIGASAKDVTFSTRYPFAKLDSTNQVSFQVISLFFNNEPPDPPLVNNSKETLVYSYPHGYKYTPSSWFLVSVDNFSTVIGPEGCAFVNPNSAIGVSSVSLPIRVDDTNVNIYVNKFWGSSTGSPPHIIGMTVSIRAYVFVEDLLGNSVPSQA